MRSQLPINPIGISLIKLKNLIIHDNVLALVLGSMNLINGRTVIDIKPYLLFYEFLSKSVAGFS
ncbi:MAG: TrmO family methyltransferase domain-containing protein [Arsenophonus sp. NC-PY1-MAG3]